MSRPERVDTQRGRPHRRKCLWGTIRHMVPVLTIGALLIPAQASAQSSSPGEAQGDRLNHLITKLERGEVIVGGSMPTGERSAAITAANSGWDFVWFEMEHSGFDLRGLELSLQFLLNRRQILEQGTLAPPVVPMVRVPQYGREYNEWIVKQVLDYGVYGILFPHIATAEQALHAVAASRYPQPIGAANRDAPSGLRGTAPGGAMRWWGIDSFAEYHRRAGVWPLDPDGEVLVWVLIETVEGFENLPEILENVPVSAVIAAEVDMSTSMGIPDGRFDPRVVEVMERITALCLEHGVPVGGLVTRANVEQRVREGWQVLLTGDPEAIAIARRTAAELRNER